MATTKKTVSEQYRNILAEKGERLEDCTVLAFVFPTMGQAKAFHFSVMNTDPTLPYLIFDTTTERTQVVVKKDAVNEGRLRAIAEIHRGKRTTALI